MKNQANLPSVFCAIDTPDEARAAQLIAAMSRAGCGIKIGLEFFVANGAEAVARLMRPYPDLPLFLDLKFHDIPNTTAGAVRSTMRRLNPAYINVHAAGGADMMKAALEATREEAARTGVIPPRLLAVTVLTSLDDAALMAVGYQPPAEARVVQMAGLARQAGLDGIVCSAHEIAPVRAACGPGFVLMVPGIRMETAGTDDQKRTMTPQQAVQAGATHLVIGRPIIGAADPESAARTILQGLAVDNSGARAGS